MTLKRILIGFLVTFTAHLVLPMSVSAEIVVFRKQLPEYYEGTTIHKGACFPMSLSETITTKVSGTTGPGCSFSIDATADGDWVDAGGYYNTPPYAWGSNQFYTVQFDNQPDIDRTFSYTCQQPSYSLNETSLPGYVELINTEVIPGSGSTRPDGKRYFFKVANSAPANSSFTLQMGFASTCTMYKRENDTGLRLTSVDPKDSEPTRCGKASIINANPRGKTRNLPITLGAGCVPPTLTPMPYIPPSPTPTPTKVACNGPCTNSNQCDLTTCNMCSSAGTCKAACNQPCTNSSQCPQECGICSTSGRCQPPPPTPTMTPAPVCGGSCIPNVDTCPLACPLCVGSGTQGICMRPSPTPTLTPTPTLAACGGPCTTSNQCNQQCPQCVTGTNGQGSCRAACGTSCTSSDHCQQGCPLCGPNPSGSGTICRQPASCDCDGIQFTGDVSPGGQTEVTAYAKVSDPDNNDAKVLNMTYIVEKNGVQVTQSSPIAVSAPERTTDTQGAAIDRYKTTWSYQIPQGDPGGTEFRIRAKIVCGYKSVTYARGPQSRRIASAPHGRVLGTETQNTNIVTQIIQNVANTFGFVPATPTPTTAPPQTPNFTFEATEPLAWSQWKSVILRAQSKVDSVKLGTFDPLASPTPTPKIEQSCKEVRFWIP